MFLYCIFLYELMKRNYFFIKVISELLIFHMLINRKVESVLRHGSVRLTWSSFPLDKFFQNVDSALFELKHLVKTVCYSLTY